MLKVKNQRGLATVAVLGIVLVVAAVAGAGWYVWNNKDKNSQPALSAEDQAAADAAQAACKAEIDDDDFCQFASNWTGLGAYTMVMTTTSADGNGTSTYKSDGNGNYSSESDYGGQKSAVVSLNNTTYVQDPTDGAWIKYTNDSTYKVEDQSEDLQFDFESTEVASTTTYEKIGTEACGDKTCLKYQVIDTTTPGTTTYIWFDTDEYKMRRWSVADAQGSTDMVVSYESVNITEPSPVKEAPTYEIPDFSL